MRPIDADALMEQVIRKKPEIATARYTEGFNDAILRVRSMIHSAPTLVLVLNDQPTDTLEYPNRQRS